VIDLENPKSETVRVLPGEALSETRGGTDFKVVEHDHRAARRLVHRQKKSVLALSGIGRAVDQNKLRALQALERLALRRDVERFNGTEAIPATRERNDVGKISLPLAD
jgi:hypothetical protein